jgi:hypothetical protein
MTEIDFYRLPRSVQDNLLDAFHGRFSPVPILAKRATRPTGVVWLVVSALATILLAVLLSVGFGDLESALALHPTWTVALYIALAATAALGVLKDLAHRSELRSLPFPSGVFVFPANVIDARQHRLRVYPLTKLSSVKAGAGGAVTLTLGGASFSFPVADASRAAEAVRAVEAARARLNEPLDGAQRRQLDPFEPPAVESPLASHVVLSRTIPWWQSRGWLLAVGVGALFGGALFMARNAMSDARASTAAQARDDVAAYKSYLARGRRDTGVVSDVLLPRAELRLAVAVGSVEAIDAFIVAYPKTGIQPEVDAARRAALSAELERAKKVGTLAALMAFAERYPEQRGDAELGRAKHALYVQAVARYKKEMPPGGEATAELVGKLVAHAERLGPKKTEQGYRGPGIVVRFRPLPSKEMDRADDLVRLNPMFNGTRSLPSQHLDPAKLEPHAVTTARTLADELARRFDPEILTFEPGPPIQGSDEELLAVTVPTLVVSFRVETSGAAYATKNPRGIFLGLLFHFKTDFVVPGDPKPARWKYTSSQRVPVDMLTDPAATGLEAKIYEAMARAAFADAGKRYLAKWFKAP